MKIDQIRGRIADLSIRTELNETRRVRRTVARFRLGQTQVEYRFAKPGSLQNGDNVTSSGMYTHEGAFSAMAIKNHDSGTISGNYWPDMMAAAIACFIFSVTGIVPAIRNYHTFTVLALFQFVISALFLACAIMLIRRAFFSRAFVGFVRHEAEES